MFFIVFSCIQYQRGKLPCMANRRLDRPGVGDCLRDVSDNDMKSFGIFHLDWLQLLIIEADRDDMRYFG